MTPQDRYDVEAAQPERDTFADPEPEPAMPRDNRPTWIRWTSQRTGRIELPALDLTGSVTL